MQLEGQWQLAVSGCQLLLASLSFCPTARTILLTAKAIFGPLFLIKVWPQQGISQAGILHARSFEGFPG